ncbi:MAG: PilZ domain-containing protein [Acidobacteria bacterium]|nr:PilZ domain-containing protein [Acidobacteriota bacterium]MCI0718519.1 PilZ domain-containing protein [Acidobacteriota bacterium]
MAKSQRKAIEGFLTSSDHPRIAHVLWGGCAFVFYQVVLLIVLQFHGVMRNPALLLLEVLVFALVATCLALYSNILALRNNGLVPAKQDAEEEKRLQAVRIEAQLSKRLGTFCQGIEHSLSAIMFFARAQLGRKASPQLERDLREVMERIDQVQLLVQEMRRSVENLGSLDSTNPLLAASAGDLAEPPASVTAPDTTAGEFKGSSGLYSLRKTARKVVILPITVSYLSEDTQLQFHTYTVNVCEDGACIVFSGKDLGSQSEIGVRMPEEFAALAKIRWIQPSRENSFRLAGIEFIDQKVKVEAL